MVACKLAIAWSWLLPSSPLPGSGAVSFARADAVPSSASPDPAAFPKAGCSFVPSYTEKLVSTRCAAQTVSLQNCPARKREEKS
jgi:hypothetical protein